MQEQSKKTKGRKPGAVNKKPPATDAVRFQIVLSPDEVQIAQALGNGIASKGIRRALNTLRDFSK